jgi:hypothetical protein
MREDMVDLFESAARLQALLDDHDICLVGGSASSYCVNLACLMVEIPGDES